MKAAPPAPTAEEVRKGHYSQLQVKKIETEATRAPNTGYTTMDTSMNGTRFEVRKSVDRTTANMASQQDYGSVMSPASPVKVGKASKL